VFSGKSGSQAVRKIDSWRFGDYNPDQVVSSFEKQFRLNLSDLYHLLGEHAPAYLSLSFTQGSGEPVMGGTKHKGTD